MTAETQRVVLGVVGRHYQNLATQLETLATTMNILAENARRIVDQLSAGFLGGVDMTFTRVYTSDMATEPSRRVGQWEQLKVN